MYLSKLNSSNSKITGFFPHSSFKTIWTVPPKYQDLIYLHSFSTLTLISICFFNQVSSCSLQPSSHPLQQHNHHRLLTVAFYCHLCITICRTNFLFSTSFPCSAQKDNSKNPLRAPCKELNPSHSIVPQLWTRWWAVTFVEHQEQPQNQPEL